jgi:hypothetical protein
MGASADLGCIVEVMSRSIAASVLALALGVLPVVHDVCGPECAMGPAPVLVAGTAAADLVPGDVEECPLHPAQKQAPAHEADGCTHDHGTVQEAPDSLSALAPSVPQFLDLPVTTFSRAMPVVTAHPRDHAVVSPPVKRSSQLLPLRI